MTERTHGRDLTPEQLAQTISEFVNCNGERAFQQVADAVMCDHRTLQQQTFGLLFTILRGWADATGYDARNELTVKLAKAIMAGTFKVKFDRGHEVEYTADDLRIMPCI